MEIPKTPYQLEVTELFKALNSDINRGLSSEEIKNRQRLFGLNQLGKLPPPSIPRLLFRQFTSPLVYLLIFVALLSFLSGNILETWVIIVLVIFNALIGFFQEYKAEKASRALQELIEVHTQRLSEGKIRKVGVENLVPGDVVHLEPGSKVPADLRIFYSNDLRVDESVLTGESTLIEKTPVKLTGTIPISGQRNMLFASTVVVSGVAKAIVCATGIDTEIGKIAKTMKEVKVIKTPLQERLEHFSSLLLKIVFLGGSAIAIIGFIRGFEIFEILFIASAAIVSAIPEGLPAIVTIALAIGVSRMTRRSAIVRKLSAIETLGSVSLIACDKTGTLTYNRMTVVNLFTPHNTYTFKGEGLSSESKVQLKNKPLDDEIPTDLNRALRVSALCNNAFLFKEKTEWKAEGDPTEVALLVAAKKAGIEKEKLLDRFAKLDEIPFVTERHYMATLHRHKKGKSYIAVKGTIEKILKSSTHYQDEGILRPLNSDTKQKIIEANEKFSLNSERVVALAFKETDSEVDSVSEKDIKNLVFLGLAGMIDSPRKETYAALQAASRAGIKVVMLTGDHHLTARAIARKLGILRYDEEAIGGEELNKLTDEQLLKKMPKLRVFSRILPKDKLRITRLFQEKDYVVAVTGDGVNDAPAIKKADIGIAMGRAGTDLARESADLILLNDNFATIIAAIEEGRKVFQNIRRVVFYLVSTNIAEMMVILSGLLLGLPLPLTPLQILWINLVTDGTSDIALAFEPKHKHALARSPNKKREPILNRVLWIRTLIVGAIMTIGGLSLYWWALQNHDLKYARTLLFMVMIIFQLWNVFNCRSLKYSITKLPFWSNPYIPISVFVSFCLAIVTVYTPWGQTFFSTTAIGFKDWIVIILVSLPILFVVEIEKAIRLKQERRWQR